MKSRLLASRHASDDWCHICGLRGHPLADISYTANAEHGGALERYIRICSGCGKMIHDVATGVRETVDTHK